MKFKTYREASAYAKRHRIGSYRIVGMVFGEVKLIW